MKFVAMFLLALLTSCAPVTSERLTSPSGHFVAATEISGQEAGATRRHCVKLRVVENASRKEWVMQTGASNAQKWAIDWSPGDVLVLYSSDIGTYAYDITESGLKERIANANEKEIGQRAFEKKYGSKPSPKLRARGRMRREVASRELRHPLDFVEPIVAHAPGRERLAPAWPQ